jgi:hypothetical protein
MDPIGRLVFHGRYGLKIDHYSQNGSRDVGASQQVKITNGKQKSLAFIFPRLFFILFTKR